MSPSQIAVNRIVDFNLDNGETLPGQIVCVFDQAVNLVVTHDGQNSVGATINGALAFPHAGQNTLHSWITSVHYSASREPGSWSWPSDEKIERPVATDALPPEAGTDDAGDDQSVAPGENDGDGQGEGAPAA